MPSASAPGWSRGWRSEAVALVSRCGHAADLRSRLQAGARCARGGACGGDDPRPLRGDRGADAGGAADRPLPVPRLPAAPRQRRAPTRSPRSRRSARRWSSTNRARGSARRLAALADGLGDREAAVAREITKRFEECVTGTLADARRALRRRAAQGRDRHHRRPARRSAARQRRGRCRRRAGRGADPPARRPRPRARSPRRSGSTARRSTPGRWR